MASSLLRKKLHRLVLPLIAVVAFCDALWVGQFVMTRAEAFARRLSVQSQASVASPSRARRSAVEGYRIRRPNLAPFARGLCEGGATHFAVDRRVLDAILANRASLMGPVRVGRRSLLGPLGIQSGDRLLTVNGFDVTRPGRALEAYSRLRSADHLTFQVARRGATRQIDCDIF